MYYRIPVWRSSVNLNYNISDLNSIIHHITVEQHTTLENPAEVFSTASKTEISAIVNPMFDFVDSTIKSKPSSILTTKLAPKKNYIVVIFFFIIF